MERSSPKRKQLHELCRNYRTEYIYTHIKLCIWYSISNQKTAGRFYVERAQTHKTNYNTRSVNIVKQYVGDKVKTNKQVPNICEYKVPAPVATVRHVSAIKQTGFFEMTKYAFCGTYNGLPTTDQ